MRILLNGLQTEVFERITLSKLREKKDPEADIVIYNGFPIEDWSRELKEGDEVYFIKRGRKISAEELERVMVSRHTPGVVEKLKNVTIGIGGAGGLGSNVAVALSRIGVGHLVLADFDVVEPSNLNRQQYFMDQLGMPKVEALKETLERINPYEKITVFHEKITRENIDLFFGECDLIIEAFDRADQKTMLIQEGIRMGKTVIAASGVAGIGEADRIVIRKVNEKLYIVGDFEREARPGEGLMAPRVMIAAAKQADLAVEILLDRLQKV